MCPQASEWLILFRDVVLMARKHLVQLVKKALVDADGPATTGAIKDFIDARYKWGTTINSVSQVLSRYPMFQKHDFVDYFVPQTQDKPGYRVRQQSWILVEEVNA
jgi:hypothetical protein